MSLTSFARYISCLLLRATRSRRGVEVSVVVVVTSLEAGNGETHCNRDRKYTTCYHSRIELFVGVGGVMNQHKNPTRASSIPVNLLR